MELDNKIELLEVLSQVEDFRVERTKLYPLNEILYLCLNAALAGCNKWTHIANFGEHKLEELREDLPFVHGIPSHDTLRYVMGGIKPDAFELIFLHWACKIAPQALHIAIDGKTLRGSAEKSAGNPALHLLHAYAADAGICLAQMKTEEKSNEITAIPELLDALEIEGRVVTIDAAGTQLNIANKIIEKGGTYILALKENRLNLFREAEEIFVRSKPLERFVEPWQKDHGRIERRICSVFDSGLSTEAEDFPGARRLVRVETERKIVRGGKIVEIQRNTRVYIASATFTASAFCSYIRAHWAIENGLHWLLDVAFSEDDSQIKNKIAAENFATINKIALNLLKQNDLKKSMVEKRMSAMMSHEFRKKLLMN